MTITEKFEIAQETEFQDIELETDNLLFADPYLIYIGQNEMAERCSNNIVNYFEQLLSFAKRGDRGNGYRIVRYLQENNEVRMGYSQNNPNGKGIGNNKGKKMFDEIAKSKAVKSGQIADIFDASIMLEGVGADRISDLTINIILEELIEFTQQQCKKHNIPLEKIKLKRPIWSTKENKWLNSNEYLLPLHNNKPIIFMPKEFVRPNLIYTYTRFYNKGIIPHYEKEIQKDPSSGLVKILKRGKVPSRTKIRENYPCLREKVTEFIEDFPAEYKSYKFKQLNYVKNDSL